MILIVVGGRIIWLVHSHPQIVWKAVGWGILEAAIKSRWWCDEHYNSKHEGFHENLLFCSKHAHAFEKRCFNFQRWFHDLLLVSRLVSICAQNAYNLVCIYMICYKHQGLMIMSYRENYCMRGLCNPGVMKIFISGYLSQLKFQRNFVTKS